MAPLCFAAHPSSFSPLAFAAAPAGAAQTLWEHCPSVVIFIAQNPRQGCCARLRRYALDGVSRCAFYELPTEQIAQRACSQHEPTWWSALSDSTVYIQTFMVQAAGFRIAVTSSSAGRKRTYSERMLKCAFGSLLIRYSTSAINLD